MVGITLEQELNIFVLSLYEQGILEHNFDYIRRLQNYECPLFVTEVINLYTVDAQSLIAQVHKSLIESSVDYNELASTVHQLREASASIGGCRVALSCCELYGACADQDKARCCEALRKVKDEYHNLSINLAHIVNLERQVLEFERKQRRQID